MQRMISIRKTDVPEYLHSSPHFENAFQGDNGELIIDIPADCMKLSSVVQTESDLCALLQTVRFWLLPEFVEDSADFYAYVINNKEALVRILPDYHEDFSILAKLIDAQNLRGKYTAMGRAAQCGLLGLMKYLRSIGMSWDSGVPLCVTSLAAKHGYLNCLKYAVDNGCDLKREACNLAAKHGHVSCLKYVHEQGVPVHLNDCKETIRNGHIECVKYMVDSKALNFSSALIIHEIAARQGNSDMLAYLLLNVGPPTIVDAANAAAAFDHLDCLKLLFDAGCPVSEITLYVAVHCGAVKCTQFLHESGIPWAVLTLQIPNNIFAFKARGKNFNDDAIPNDLHLECLLYAAEHGCPLSPETYNLAIVHGFLTLVEYLHSRGVPFGAELVRLAALERKLECLQYLLVHGAPSGADAYIMAVHMDSLECIECLHAYTVPWDIQVTRTAVLQGRVEILRFLLQHGCPCCEDLSVAAVASSKAGCLQYLHEFGCTLGEEVVGAACEAGALECLQYALENGCPYPADACSTAASGGFLSCLQCLHEHGAPLTEEVLQATLLSFEAKNIACLTYIVSQKLTELGPIAAVAVAAFKSNKHLQCIHELGVPMSTEVALTAIRSNSLECLKYALENGCPLEASLSAEAARNGNRGMLRLLHKAGCPWDSRTTTAALERDCADCLQYAVSFGCPFDQVSVSEELLARSPRCAEYILNSGDQQP